MTDPAQPDFSQLLDHMAQGSIGPLSRLAESLNLTISQISKWIEHPHNRHTIVNLVTLLDAQTQLMVCQHRLIAVARLAEVCATADSPETVRRACKDLLAVRLIDPYKEDERPEKAPPPPEVSEEKILEALERLGDADYSPRPRPPVRFEEPADAAADDAACRTEPDAGFDPQRRAQTNPYFSESRAQFELPQRGRRAFGDDNEAPPFDRDRAPPRTRVQYY